MQGSDTGVFGVGLAAQAEQLRRSLQSHPNPDVATGMLMVLHGCDEDQAFAELLLVCEQEQVMLPDLVDALVRLVGRNNTAALGAVSTDGEAAVDARALAAAERVWGPRARAMKPDRYRSSGRPSLAQPRVPPAIGRAS